MFYQLWSYAPLTQWSSQSESGVCLLSPSQQLGYRLWLQEAGHQEQVHTWLPSEFLYVVHLSTDNGSCCISQELSCYMDLPTANTVDMDPVLRCKSLLIIESNQLFVA